MKTKKHEAKRAFSLREFARKALTVLLTISMVTMNTPFAYAAEALDIAEDSKVVEQGTIVEEGTVGEEQDSKDAEKSDDGQLDDELPDVEPAEEELQNVELDSTEDEPSDVASTVSTQANEDASQTEPIAEIVELEDITPDGEVELSLDFAQAYITYQGQMIGLPMTSINVPANTDFRFSAAADEGCTLSVVKATLAGHETVLEPDAEGFYTIPAEQVVAGISLSVKAEGDPFAIETSADDIDVQRNEKSEFEYEDKSIKVTATLTDPSALPEGVTFKVTPVTQKSKDYNYDAYMEALNNSAGEENKYNSTNTLLYDVAFLMPKLDEKGKQIADEWVEVQLDSGQVQLNIEFKKDQLSNKLGTDDPSDIVVTHLPLIDSVRSSVDTTADAKSISAQDVLVEAPEQSSADVLTQSVEVSLDSLSLLAVRNTASAEEPQNAGQTQDETQDEPVAPSINESTNLADFLTSATFNAPQNQDGTYVVTPNTNYQFTLTFAERYNTDDTLQFPNSNADMTYTLPAGLEVANGHTGYFTISVKEGADTVYNITNNTYSINNGILKVNLNSGHEYFSKLAAAPNARFTLSFEGSVSKTADKLLFADGIEKDIEVDDSNSVTVLKSSKVDLNGKKVAYTITVQSRGTSKNVHVKDTISSTTSGLISGLSSFSIKSSVSSHNVSSITPTMGNGQFEYVIPQMSDGEVITITYNATIDPTKLSADQNSRFVGVTKNEAEVWSDGDPEHDTAPVQTTIDYTPTVIKNKGTVIERNGKKQTIKWTIDANSRRVVSMAGTTITDTIASGSQSIMKYSGSGIKVEVIDADNKVVRTDNVPWSQLDEKTDTTWTYRVPASDAGKAYKYTITYTTEVDTTTIQTTTNVGNTVRTGGGKTSSNSGSVTPVGGGVTAKKEATNVDLENMRISWKVTFNVPADGLTKAAFGDTYPAQWVDGANREEKIIPGSVQVTGLINNEYLRMRQKSDTIWLTLIKEYNGTTALPTYDPETQLGYDAESHVRYYKKIANISEDPISTYEVEGCDPSNQERIITITFDTEINDVWYNASKTEEGKYLQDKHINNGTLEADGSKIQVSAQATVIPPSVKKTGTYVGSRTVNGAQLPVYKYEVSFSDVESDDLEITDDFDTSILEYYTGTEGGVSDWDSGYVFYGNKDSQHLRGGKFNVTLTDTGIKITTNAQCLPRNGEQYYDMYKVVYYLTVKDASALNRIKSLAAASDGGVYKIHNAATFNGITGEADVTYQYEGLKKELLNESELTKTNEDIWPEFRITLNPGAELLNKGEPLTMTDTVQNLNVDITSIRAEPSEGVTWDMTGNTVTYSIPDATKVVITYRARVALSSSPTPGTTQHITFSNTAEMKGYSDNVEQTAVRKNEGAGSASIASINLMKYEAGNMKKTLPGAKFQLQDANGKPIRDKDNKPVEFVTDSNGMINIEGHLAQLGWAIKEDTTYLLEELEAPAGYMLPDFKYNFTVAGNGVADYENWIYYSGDTMSAKNYPGTDVRVLKTWTDG
ncbi:MAG: prealbumin-like fold domain-containing protein, partial [Coriobacteriales bacterium]|nr:prealbumin-like fold domain-containing protein [Coriobacteriales bacterium]